MDPKHFERLDALHADFGGAVDRVKVAIDGVDDWVRSGHKARPEHVSKLLALAADLTRIAHSA